MSLPVHSDIIKLLHGMLQRCSCLSGVILIPENKIGIPRDDSSRERRCKLAK